ncbi:melanocyte-stimulating hormone receptor-like [Oculina patagonica]
MMEPNFTEDGNQKAYEESYCTADLNSGTHYKLAFLSVINIFLAITAFVENSLIMVALYKESSLHPPSKLLFGCLATTDLCVGLIAEPLYAVYLISVLNERWNICLFAFATDLVASYILVSVSLLTLTAISVDRLLALLLGLRYKQIVTLKRTYITLTAFWVASILAATMYFWNNLLILWYGHVLIALCLVISLVCHIKIFLTLRRLQIQVKGHINKEQHNQMSSLNIARYKKAVFSALWVQFTLVVCNLPFVVVDALATHSGLTSSVFIAKQFAITLVYFNSSLNPILYCWKIREVRQAVKDTIQGLCCSWTNFFGSLGNDDGDAKENA